MRVPRTGRCQFLPRTREVPSPDTRGTPQDGRTSTRLQTSTLHTQSAQHSRSAFSRYSRNTSRRQNINTASDLDTPQSKCSTNYQLQSQTASINENPRPIMFSLHKTSKAFVTVCHATLLKLINESTLPGTLARWLATYLHSTGPRTIQGHDVKQPYSQILSSTRIGSGSYAVQFLCC